MSLNNNNNNNKHHKRHDSAFSDATTIVTIAKRKSSLDPTKEYAFHADNSEVQLSEKKRRRKVQALGGSIPINKWNMEPLEEVLNLEDPPKLKREKNDDERLSNSQNIEQDPVIIQAVILKSTVRKAERQRIIQVPKSPKSPKSPKLPKYITNTPLIHELEAERNALLDSIVGLYSEIANLESHRDFLMSRKHSTQKMMDQLYNENPTLLEHHVDNHAELDIIIEELIEFRKIDEVGSAINNQSKIFDQLLSEFENLPLTIFD